MEQRLKQRLLGTAVLVALAVIIVPEVVKTSGPLAPPAASTNIPPRPEPPHTSGVTVALPPPVAPVPVTNPVPPPVAAEAPVSTPAPTVAQSPTPAPVKSPATPAGGDGPQGMRTVDISAGAPRVTPAPTPKPAPSKPAASAQVAQAQPRTPVPATVPGAAASRTAEPPKTPEVARPKPAPEAVARATPTPPATARPVSLPKIELTSRGSTAQSAGPAPAAEPWRPQGGAGGTWAVQVGSFGVEENANLLRDRLRSQRFPAVVERIRGGSQTMYRVRVVGQDSRPASEAMASRLRSAGVAANIVEPGE